MSAPCDLRASVTSNKIFPEDYILQAIKLGYKTIAVDQTITLAQLEKVHGKFQFPVIRTPQSFLDKLSKLEGGSSVKILSRVTVEYSAQTRFHKQIKPALEKFDIIAARPQDDKALERLLDEEIDIISLDGGLKSAYFLKKELIKKVMVKDLVFELEYAPCVSDSSVMGNTIQLAQDLLTFCKGKNLILSSGHSNPLFIRGPYDVINLAVLFGLPTNLAKETVFGGALNVVKYAEGRKSLSVNIDIKPKKSLEEPAEPMKRPVETSEHHQPAVKKFKSWS